MFNPGLDEQCQISLSGIFFVSLKCLESASQLHVTASLYPIQIKASGVPIHATNSWKPISGWWIISAEYIFMYYIYIIIYIYIYIRVCVLGSWSVQVLAKTRGLNSRVGNMSKPQTCHSVHLMSSYHESCVILIFMNIQCHSFIVSHFMSSRSQISLSSRAPHPSFTRKVFPLFFLSWVGCWDLAEVTFHQKKWWWNILRFCRATWTLKRLRWKGLRFVGHFCRITSSCLWFIMIGPPMKHAERSLPIPI